MRGILHFLHFIGIFSIFVEDYGDYLSLNPPHPLAREFSLYLTKCIENFEHCQDHDEDIALLIVKMSNEHASLLLHDRVQSMLIESFYDIPPSISLGEKLTHILSVLYFSQGEFQKVGPQTSSLILTTSISFHLRLDFFPYFRQKISGKFFNS
jgi:hypothetical protein